MSNRINFRNCRSAIALGILAVTTASFSGCTTLGSHAFGDPIVTGSTTTAAGGDVNQSMPQALGPQSSSNGRYVPPADVGGGSGGAGYPAFNTAPASANNAVISQDLPSLNSSSQPGSPQTMPAQQSIMQSPVASSAPVMQSAAPSVPQTGYTHIIESGESLYSIARKYKVTTDSLMFANKLSSPDKIFVGQKIVVPGVAAPTTPTLVASVESVKPAPLANKPKVAAAPIAKAEPVATAPVEVATAAPVVSAPVKVTPPAAGDGKFRWPVSGKLINDFAASKGTGVDIAVPEGTAVRAAETGTVIYVGSAVEGYGNLILIKHDNGFVSAYAHLSQITVSKGDAVMRGDAIGLAGSTGSVTSSQLHFELRKGATPVDPIPMLAS